MKNDRRTVFDWLDVTKNIVEIAALIAAGFWAYAKYVESEAPSLEFRGGISTELDWSPIPRSADCLGEFRVKITNNGRASFEVRSVHLRIWIADFPAKVGPISRLNPDQFETSAPTITETTLSKPLTGHYAPGVSDSFDYHFITRRNEEKLQVAKVRVDVLADTGELSSSHWDYVCERMPE